MQPTGSYRLLDCGHGRKLEQIGSLRLIRPAPQAFWRPALDAAAWQQADAEYIRKVKDQQAGESGIASGSGRWFLPGSEQAPSLPETWSTGIDGLEFEMRPTPFGHVGLFFEQIPNWKSLTKLLTDAPQPLEVLNLFAYSGAASLFAARAGARVTHVDASRGIVDWARLNAEQNSLQDLPVRWIVEDVRKYLQREIKRGRKYDVVIMDPPTFGRGPRGQVFKIEDEILPLLDEVASLMSEPTALFFSCHSPNFSPQGLTNLINGYRVFRGGHFEAGEMTIPSDEGNCLPNGIHLTWLREQP